MISFASESSHSSLNPLLRPILIRDALSKAESILPKRAAETVSEESEPNLPKSFALHQNYPNPFNPTTTIRFALPQHSLVTLKLYDILGREVAKLVDEELEPGVHQIEFDAKYLASGLYFYTIQAKGFKRTKKLVLLNKNEGLAISKPPVARLGGLLFLPKNPLFTLW